MINDGSETLASIPDIKDSPVFTAVNVIINGIVKVGR